MSSKTDVPESNDDSENINDDTHKEPEENEEIQNSDANKEKMGVHITNEEAKNLEPNEESKENVKVRPLNIYPRGEISPEITLVIDDNDGDEILSEKWLALDTEKTMRESDGENKLAGSQFIMKDSKLIKEEKSAKSKEEVTDVPKIQEDESTSDEAEEESGEEGDIQEDLPTLKIKDEEEPTTVSGKEIKPKSKEKVKKKWLDEIEDENDEEKIVQEGSNFSKYVEGRFKKASKKHKSRKYTGGIGEFGKEITIADGEKKQEGADESAQEPRVSTDEKPEKKEKLGILESLEVDEEEEDSEFSEKLVDEYDSDELEADEEDEDDNEDEEIERRRKEEKLKIGLFRSMESEASIPSDIENQEFSDIIFDSIKLYAETTKEERKKEEEGLGINSPELEEESGREEDKILDDKEEVIVRGPANMKYRLIIEEPDEEEEEFVAEEQEEVEEGVEEEVYIYDEIVSKPFLSENSTFMENTLEFNYSYGYNCQKRYNLIVADENHLIFASGNLIHIFNIKNQALSFKRTVGGGGIGHIARNFTNNHIAIGEKGNDPYLIIYDWPSFEIVTVLKGGAEKEYVHLHYREDGEYLASQSGEPDYLITIWNWKKEKILLQVKSHGQDVFYVEFSRFVDGNLTTGGLGHVKFWKMAKTFTGLKLQGELGKFGKTNICDITGSFAMPDEKVVTGCDWGNILVWDEGLIKFQVERKLEKRDIGLLEDEFSIETSPVQRDNFATSLESLQDQQKEPSLKESVTSARKMDDQETASYTTEEVPKFKEKPRKEYLAHMTKHKYKQKRLIDDTTEDVFSYPDPTMKVFDEASAEMIEKESTRQSKHETVTEYDYSSEDDKQSHVTKSSISQKRKKSVEKTNVFFGDPVRDKKWAGIECVSTSGSETSLSIDEDQDEGEKDNDSKKCEECVEMEEEPYEDSLNEYEDIDSKEKIVQVPEKVQEENEIEEKEVEQTVVIEKNKSVLINHEKCHEAPIAQFSYNARDDYLQTIGLDGYVKTWYYKFINEQDPSEDNPFVFIEPSHELLIEDEIGRASCLSYAKGDLNDSNYNWFIQDCNGGIWKANVANAANIPKPERIFSCHSGPITGMACSPIGNYVATSGNDGWLHIYDMNRRKLIIQRKFIHPIHVLIWLPRIVDNNGNSLMVGNSDGKILVIIVSIVEFEDEEGNESIRASISSVVTTDIYLSIIFSMKSHTKPVRAITMNRKGTIAVSGSDDCTVFAYHISSNDVGTILQPIGFIRTQAPVTWISSRLDEDFSFLICCKNGQFMETQFPKNLPMASPKSFELKIHVSKNVFKSVKSELRRQAELDKIEEKKKAKIARKKVELAKIRAENPGLDINEELYLVDSDEDIEWPPLYYPEEPSQILFAIYQTKDLIWLSMGEYDAGYIYVYKIDNPNPVKCFEVPGLGDYEISSYTMFCPDDIMVLGLGNGKIRLVKYNPDEPTDISNYWELAMHDNSYGKLTNVCLSHDQKYLYTSGADGNIFSYEVNLESYHTRTQSKFIYFPGIPEFIIEETTEKELSLEEHKIFVANEGKMAEIEMRKSETRELLRQQEAKLRKILLKNESLPIEYRVDTKELEVDPRLTKLTTDKIENEMKHLHRMFEYKLEKSQLAYKKLYDYFVEPVATFSTTVRAIRRKISATTFVHTKLSSVFYEAQNYLRTKMSIFDDKGRFEKHIIDLKRESDQDYKKPMPIMPWLRGISSFYDKLNTKTLRALDSYYSRHKTEEERKYEWELFLASKPDSNKMDPRDLAFVDNAIRNIGDYKLKTSDDFRVPKHKRVSTRQKYAELLTTRRKIYETKSFYNRKVLALRDEKVIMVKTFLKLYAVLKKIHEELPPHLVKCPPDIPKIIEDEEFPERRFQIEPGPLPHEITIEDDLTEVDKYVLYPNLSQFKFKKEIIDEPITVRELELRERRRKLKIQKQENLLKEMEEIIKAFDKRVQKVHMEQLEIAINVKLLEIHLLSLHQELAVTKSYEKLENELSLKVAALIFLKHIKILKINLSKKKMGHFQKEITSNQEKEKDIHRTFQEMIAENKFADFLTRIFKKKYKPPKIRDDGDEESSSSSSSSESSEEEEGGDEGDEDEGLLDLIKLDENICPEGLEQEIYDKTFVLRKRRHEVEQAIQDLKKQTETVKREGETHTKKVQQIEVVLALHLSVMERFQINKQKKLNQIGTVVMMQAKQLQHINPNNTYQPLDETVVFPKDTLIKLNERVAELDAETKKEILKHQKYKTHLKRMNIDLKRMEEQAEGLKKKITSEMVARFGCVINIGLMEDMILKNMIMEERSSVGHLHQTINREVAKFKLQMLDRSEKLAAIQRVNTEKLHLLCALEEEKGKVTQLVHKQQEKRNRLLNRRRFENEMKLDVHKLKSALKDLTCQKQKLQQEIKNLSLKGRPLPPIPKNRGKLLPLLYDVEEPEEIKQELFRNIEYNEIFEGNTLVPSQADSYLSIYTESVKKEEERDKEKYKRYKEVLIQEQHFHRSHDEISYKFDLDSLSLPRGSYDVEKEEFQESEDVEIKENRELEETITEIVTKLIKEGVIRSTEEVIPSGREGAGITIEDETKINYKEVQKYSELLVTETVNEAMVTITRQFVFDILEKAKGKVQKPLIAKKMNEVIDKIIRNATRITALFFDSQPEIPDINQREIKEKEIFGEDISELKEKRKIMLEMESGECASSLVEKDSERNHIAEGHEEETQTTDEDTSDKSTEYPSDTSISRSDY